MARLSVAVLASLVVLGCGRGESRPETPGTASAEHAPTPLAVGTRVPALTLRAHTGQTLELAKLGNLLAREGARVTLRVPEREIGGVVGHLLGTVRAVDLAIEDPPLEDVLRAMFGKNRSKEPS